LLQDQALKKQIHKANIEVHRSEAKYYEALHPEVYSKKEQKRIVSTLACIDKQIEDNQKKALDIGAGTGNLTGKLLTMGYNVTATDISPEMCEILRTKYSLYMPEKLRVINSPIEELTSNESEFDLITSYSVLHHLPNYVSALKILTRYLKIGGVMYIDHEASPSYWEGEPSSLASIIKAVYFQIIGLKVPAIDYTLSDYWHKKEHALSHQEIEQVFKESGFASYKRIDHYLHATWLPNPLSIIYRLLCSPEMSYWIAKK
jgi:2-polyprenyl-3-methyl-5-hydroxy-6-metoxy-1,4-benzoquinol methylase